VRPGNRHREHAENQPANRAPPAVAAAPFRRAGTLVMSTIAMAAFLVPESESVLQT
jgi:hypothetical protein